MSINLAGIAIKRESGGKTFLRDITFIDYTGGVENDFRGSRLKYGGKRQVTLMSEEQWLEVRTELGVARPWQVRGANLLIRGLNFEESHIKKTLLIGPEVELEITGRTVACPKMDKIIPGLQTALNENCRGGVTCRVKEGGWVRNGDLVTFKP